MEAILVDKQARKRKQNYIRKILFVWLLLRNFCPFFPLETLSMQLGKSRVYSTSLMVYSDINRIRYICIIIMIIMLRIIWF